MTLIASPSFNETYGTTTNISCSADNTEVTPRLYRNGTEVSLPDIQMLRAADYAYVCNATASQNYTAGSDTNTLTINKASTTTTLYLDGSQANKSITFGATSNATATTSVGSLTLYRDGQTVSNPEITALGVATYNYTAVNLGNENFTASSATWFLTVNKAASAVNLLLDGTDGNITVEVGSTVNETGTRTTGESTIELYEQGSLVNSGTSPLTNLTAYNTLGTFNVTVSYPASANYSTSSETHWITVQDTTVPVVTLSSPANNTNSATQTQGFTFNYTDNYYSTASCTVYINNIASGTNASVASGFSTTITNTSVPEGVNTWEVNCTDGSSNTGASIERTITIDLTSPAITLVRPAQDDIVGYIISYV